MKKRKNGRRLRRWLAGLATIVLILSAMPWSLLAKTESVTSVRTSGGYTSINWEKSAFLPGNHYQVLNMEFHTTNEGNVAYCLQQLIGNPTDQEISYEEGNGSEVFSSAALEAVKHVLLNGYPMNQEMWGDIPAQGQREATQIAIWYLMSHFDQAGSGANGSASAFSTIMDKDCIQNETKWDVVGMAKTLIQCGLTGQDLLEHKLGIGNGEMTEESGRFHLSVPVQMKGLSQLQGTIAGIQGSYRLYADDTEIPVSGGAFAWDMSSEENLIIRIEMDAFENQEREVTLKLSGMDVRNLPGLFFLGASGDYQKMMGVRLQEQKVVEDEKKVVLPDYIPPDTKIQIIKKDSESGERLSGAGFQIYKAEEVLAVNGWSDFPKEAGRLQVREEDLVSCEPVEIQEGGDSIMYTGEEGILTTKPLPYGEYLVVEKETPEGYLAAAPQVVTFSGKGEECVTLTVYDQLFRVSLQVQKKDSVTGVDICQPGICYELLDEAKNPLDLGLGSVFGTNEEGVFAIPYELPGGTYYLREIQAPCGYAKSDEDILVQITCGQVSLTQNGKVTKGIITEHLEDGTYHFQASCQTEDDPIIMEIAKKHPFGEGGLAGAVLELRAKNPIYAADQTILYQAGETIREWISGTDSEFFYGIPAGDYELVEKEAPLGYDIAESKDVQVEETKEPQMVVLENSPQRIGVELLKINEDQQPLEGVVFALQYGEDIYEEDRLVFTKGQSVLDEEGEPILLTTDAEGKAYAEGLYGWVYHSDGEAGEEILYQLQERKAALGYVCEEEPYVLGEEDWLEEQNRWVIIWENACQEGKIRIEKKGLSSVFEKGYPSEYGEIFPEEQREIPLEGAEFTLYADEEAAVPLEVIRTGEDGWGESSLLPVGIYYLRETKTPKGYLPDTTLYPCEILGDDSGIPQVPTRILTLVNDSCQVRILLEKLGRSHNEEGDWERLYLAGAVFGLYQEGKLLDTAVTEADGTTDFSGRYPAGDYEIRELVAPEGFALCEEPVLVSLEPANESIEVVIEPEKIMNHAASGKLTIEKVDGMGKPLEGVEFTLTNEETEHSFTGATDSMGILEWEDLPVGYQNKQGEFIYYHYKLEETKTPEGYLGMEGVKQFVFDQENNGQEVIAIRTKVVNYAESTPVILGETKLPWYVHLIIIGLGAVSGVVYYHVKKRWKK